MKSIYWGQSFQFLNPDGVIIGYTPLENKPVSSSANYRQKLKEHFFSQFAPGEHMLAIIPDTYTSTYKWEEFLALPEMKGKLIYKSPKFNNANHNKTEDYLTFYVFKM